MVFFKMFSTVVLKLVYFIELLTKITEYYFLETQCTQKMFPLTVSDNIVFCQNAVKYEANFVALSALLSKCCMHRPIEAFSTTFT